MYSAILEIIEKALGANLDLELRQARVKSLAELELATGLILPLAACLLPQSLEGQTLVVGEKRYILRPPLQAGDMVILLRIGSNYVIVDRVGDLKNEQVIT